MSRFRRALATVLVLAITVIALSPLSYAAPAPSNVPVGSGYRISPVRTDLVINPGTSKTIPVYIKNVSNAPENLKVLINDFRSDNEDGAPALYLNNETAPRYSLRKYIKPSVNDTILQPDEQKSIDVKISIPANTKPGGYFGAVRFAPTSIEGSDKVNVNLAASVASLVLVTVPGDYKEQVTVASFAVTQDGHQAAFFTSPKKLQATVRFQNNGNVQEQPFGKVILRKGSTILGTYEINNTTPRGNILPDSIRRFSVDLNRIGAFGKYSLEGDFGYGNKGQLLTAKTSFWVVPIPLIFAAIAVILLLLFLIFGLPRLIRRYNSRVIRQARGRR